MEEKEQSRLYKRWSGDVVCNKDEGPERRSSLWKIHASLFVLHDRHGMQIVLP